MIYTCTFNPSVDYQMHAAHIQLGELNRINQTAFYPGGKGINVSRVLKELGDSSVALGFAGGFTGEFIIQSLEEKGIQTAFIKHEEPTRVNIKIKTDEKETEMNGPGAHIKEEEMETLLENLEDLKSGDYFILSGSRPPSIPFEFYEKIASAMQEKEAHLVLDIPEKRTAELLRYQPFLIKPNEKELAAITGRQIDNKQDAVRAAKKLVKQGARNVIVSLGKEGAIAVNKEHILQAIPPSGTLISSVGAGDSLVAGFIKQFQESQSITRAFQYGVAAGTATAYSANLCKKKEVEAILPKVTIQTWEGERQS